MTEPAKPVTESLALVFTGGGARAAYQVGVMRCLARRLPKMTLDIVTGVSAGAINALFLASRRGALADIVDELCDVWNKLELKDVIRVDSRSLARNVLGWGTKLVGGEHAERRMQGLVDTTPLRHLLERLYPLNGNGQIAGLAENIARCQPRAMAITTLNYTTGQTVTWAS